MPNREREIRSQVETVREALDQFARDIDSEAKFKALTDSVNELDGLTEWGSGLDISDFFRNIGLGLTEAQKDLDGLSLAGIKRYVDDAASTKAGGTPLPVPPVYRIPKVSAELQFTLRSKGKNSFNILLFGKEKEEELKRQHKVAFDVVAAPPPPDVLEQFETRESASLVTTQRVIEFESSVRQVLVLDLGERERVRAILRAFIDKFRDSSGLDAARNSARTMSHKRDLPRILMLRQESLKQWVCIDPGPKDSQQDPSIVLVSDVDHEDPSAIDRETVIVSPNITARWNALSSVFRELSERQRTALGEVAGLSRDEQ
jgi:hypothetical protein